MAKKYTFKVTVTLRDGDNLTRKEALEDLGCWLEAYEQCADIPGCSPFAKVEIV